MPTAETLRPKNDAVTGQQWRRCSHSQWISFPEAQRYTWEIRWFSSVSTSWERWKWRPHRGYDVSTSFLKMFQLSEATGCHWMEFITSLSTYWDRRWQELRLILGQKGWWDPCHDQIHDDQRAFHFHKSMTLQDSMMHEKAMPIRFGLQCGVERGREGHSA